MAILDVKIEKSTWKRLGIFNRTNIKLFRFLFPAMLSLKIVPDPIVPKMAKPALSKKQVKKRAKAKRASKARKK
jgi:hypothetical protein